MRTARTADGGGFLIADCPIQHDGCKWARLFAAAPDLIAALQMFVAYDDIDSTKPGGFETMLVAYVEAIDAARAAIAKAVQS